MDDGLFESPVAGEGHRKSAYPVEFHLGFTCPGGSEGESTKPDHLSRNQGPAKPKAIRASGLGLRVRSIGPPLGHSGMGQRNGAPGDRVE